MFNYSELSLIAENFITRLILKKKLIIKNLLFRILFYFDKFIYVEIIFYIFFYLIFVIFLRINKFIYNKRNL